MKFFGVLAILLLGLLAFVKADGDVCLAIYDPVCGDDGNTYGNDCLMNLAGAKLAHKGKC